MRIFCCGISIGFIAVLAGLVRAGNDQVDKVIELDAHVVTANPFVTAVDELMVPVGEMTGEALQRGARSSLGATLDGEPGVHASYFGPGSSRPVIRGFDGDRVRILNGGTDSFDASQTSPDHGVSIEPLFARDIEVVRGPASLLYGNAAIGGVVNVIGKELPRERVSERVVGQILGAYGSASDERSAGVALQGGVGDFAWSFGYLKRDSGDIEIPGLADSKYQVEVEGEEHDEHEDEVEGALENSFVDTESGYFGVTWFGEKQSFGVSFSRYATNYGVPGHAHEHEHGEGEEESVTIDLDQARLNLRGEWMELLGIFEKVEFDGAFGDYSHSELEGDEVGTRFERDGGEMRLVGVHRPIGRLTGAIGLQVKEESFSAVGEEAFVPSNDLANYGFFAMERLNTDWGAWEFGGRIESVRVDPNLAGELRRRFSVGSVSAGIVYGLSDGQVLAGNLTFAERAPNASELYAFGPHVGTQRFEIGDVELGEESSTNLDVSYRLNSGRLSGELTLYLSDFSDYVYMRSMDGATIPDVDLDGLQAVKATAVDAFFYGYEFNLRYDILDQENRSLRIEFLLDQTRAKNESFGTNLPRIPARRVGARLEYEFGAWLVGGEVRHHASASRLAPNELPTDSFAMWNADARYRIQSADRFSADLFVQGTNLGNSEARLHTSFLKDLVPLPGREIKVGVRTSF